MPFFIFSPDGKDFCQFMTPNFPKPMFLTQINPGLVVALDFYIPRNGTIGIFKPWVTEGHTQGWLKF